MKITKAGYYIFASTQIADTAGALVTVTCKVTHNGTKYTLYYETGHTTARARSNPMWLDIGDTVDVIGGSSTEAVSYGTSDYVCVNLKTA